MEVVLLGIHQLEQEYYFLCNSSDISEAIYLISKLVSFPIPPQTSHQHNCHTLLAHWLEVRINGLYYFIFMLFYLFS